MGGIKGYNVGWENIRIGNKVSFTAPNYIKTINRDNINTNYIAGSYTIRENTIFFSRNGYYAENSYGFDPREPYTIVLLENTASENLSTYYHYVSIGGQSTLTCKASSSGKYIYGQTATLSSTTDSSNMYYDEVGLHIITFGNGITRWASYWDNHAPSILQDTNTRLLQTVAEPLYYAYGYDLVEELKQSELYELNVIDREVDASEELDILQFINNKYDMTLRST